MTQSISGLTWLDPPQRCGYATAEGTRCTKMARAALGAHADPKGRGTPICGTHQRAMLRPSEGRAS